jgi:hypothetical protein
MRAAASAPAAPTAAVASQGPVDCAAAPAGHRCPLSHCIPPSASPNAWPRWLSGTTATSVSFAWAFIRVTQAHTSKITTIKGGDRVAGPRSSPRDHPPGDDRDSDREPGEDASGDDHEKRGNAGPRLCRAVVYQRRRPLDINGETWLRPASRAATRAAWPRAARRQLPPPPRVRQRRRMP